jgi:site-specific recombinase XerD
MVIKMSDYDQEVEKIRACNQPILDEFQSWLENSGLAPNTVKNHLDNIDFFSKYLVYYEPLTKLDESDGGDIYGFLGDWFPRKAMWASKASTRSNMASFRKFFRFLRESGRIDEEIENDVRDTLIEYRDEFLKAAEFDDSFW